MSDVKERRIRILRVQGKKYSWSECGKIIRGLVERGELPSDTVLEKALINGQIDMRIRSQEFSPVQPLDKIPAIVKEIPADPPMPEKTWRTATVDDVVPAEPKKVRFKRMGFGWSDGHLIGIVSGQYVVITVSETPMLAHECEVAE